MILVAHHTGEPHGILGAQAASTYIAKKLEIPSIVVGIERQFSKENFLLFLDEYYTGKEKIIGFTHLCGRKDLLELIGLVKQKGFFTILGGPQAEVDYYGEPDAEIHSKRFKGLQKEIDLAVQGPVSSLRMEHLRSVTGCLKFPWDNDLYIDVDWGNLYIFSDQINKLNVKTAQVLNAIGCPHAIKRHVVNLPLPDHMQERQMTLDVGCRGCIFCDVSRDKGFHGHLDHRNVMSQIRNLPEDSGRKIAFEIIDEYPIAPLKRMLEDVRSEGIKLSRIDLVCRIDDISNRLEILNNALTVAREEGISILFASIGFESFNDKILGLLNKGITVRDIIKCVRTLRTLKDKFGNTLLYRTDEGANHGFIHPTPWDDSETMSENNMNIAMYRLFEDILPSHSVPLIIHHSSYLGDWIRRIESEMHVAFKRDGTWIEWWNPPLCT